jgi:hypothetical protein
MTSPEIAWANHTDSERESKIEEEEDEEGRKETK